MSSGHTYKRPESVLVVIYSRTGKFLLMRRSQPADFWQSVTGSLRPDESPIDAARREVTEETGLSARNIEDQHQQNRFPILPAWRARYAPEVSENLEHVFSFCVPRDCQIVMNPEEHTACEWLNCDAAIERVASYTNRDAILQIGTAKGWIV